VGSEQSSLQANAEVPRGTTYRPSEMSAPTRIAEVDGHRSLVVSSGGWRPESLALMTRERVAGLSISVRLLVLNAGKVRDLRVLEELRELESLTLNTPRRPKLPLDFAAFPRLMSFSGYWNEGYDSVFGCHRLKRIFVFGPPDDDLSRFASLAALTRLELGQGRRLRHLRGLANLSSLAFLGLYHQAALETLDGLEGAPDLEELAIESCTKLSILDPISELRTLRTLKVANCGKIASLRPLRQLRSLEHLFAWESTDVQDGDLSVLATLPALRDVAMRDRRHYRPTVAGIEEALAARETAA
jgi:hypothetical protein